MKISKTYTAGVVELINGLYQLYKVIFESEGDPSEAVTHISLGLGLIGVKHAITKSSK